MESEWKWHSPPFFWHLLPLAASVVLCCWALPGWKCPSSSYNLGRFIGGPLRQMVTFFTVCVPPILKSCSCSRCILPFSGGLGKGLGRVRGRSQKNSHQKNFSPGFPSSFLRHLFICWAQHERGLLLKALCRDELFFLSLSCSAICPNFFLVSCYFHSAFIKINMRCNHIFY